jgi:hypothetical protein
MGRACNTHGRDEKCIHIFSMKREGNRPLGDLGVDGREILKWGGLGCEGCGSRKPCNELSCSVKTVNFLT